MKLVIPLPLDPPEEDPPLLEPDEDAMLPEPVEDAVDRAPVVELELRETKTPPETVGGEVLLPVLAAASSYASRVFGDGGALGILSALCSTIGYR